MSDTILIQACNAVLAADAAFHAAAETSFSTHARKLGDRRQALLTNVLAMQAATLEGIKAKACLISGLYDWPATGSAEGRDRLVASLLKDLGATVPEGFATA